MKDKLELSWNEHGRRTSWLIPVLCCLWLMLFNWSWNSNAIYYTGALSVYTLLHKYIFTSLITALFVHDGIAHLGGNMIYLLIILGMLYYLNVNDNIIWVTFLVSGLIGNLLMVGLLFYQHSNALIVGASGSIYGLYGLTFFELILKRKVQHVSWKWYVVYNFFLFMLLYGLGIVSFGTDVLHLTGLTIGSLLGMYYFRKRVGFGGDDDKGAA